MRSARCRAAASVPLLANLYLHYVFDLWVQRWRTTQARGDVIVVRFADDFVVGFQHRVEAERFLSRAARALREVRAGSCIPTRRACIEFGRYADQNRRGRGDGKPETFNFLGFTHSCGEDAEGTVHGAAADDAQAVAGQAASGESRTPATLHQPIPEQGAYLRSVVIGHFRYYGVPMNGRALHAFRRSGALWHGASCAPEPEATTCPGAGWAPTSTAGFRPPRICHPYPLVRFAVITQGKSRMR